MRFIVACYRITRLKALDSDKIKEIGEGMRDTIETMGADFIDVAQDSDGNMVVVARYPDDSAMEAASFSELSTYALRRHTMYSSG